MLTVAGKAERVRNNLLRQVDRSLSHLRQIGGQDAPFAERIKMQPYITALEECRGTLSRAHTVDEIRIACRKVDEALELLEPA